MNNFESTNQSTMSLNSHMLKTFSWMGMGVAITFIIASILGSSNIMYRILYHYPSITLVLFISQIGVVLALLSRLQKLSTSSARALFIIYSILTGITFSFIFGYYRIGSITYAFGISVVFFGSLVAIGYTTKRNLDSLGTIALAALVAMIIFMAFALIFNISTNSMIFGFIGLAIFAALTAWDTRRMVRNYKEHEDDEIMLENLSIYSAFELYLDFINIFLYILRFVGRSK